MANQAIVNLINSNITKQGDSDSITGVEIRAVLLAMNSFLSDDISFTTVVPFTKLMARMAANAIAGPTTFTRNTAGAYPNATVTLRYTANGTHTPTFSGYKKASGSMDWVNVNGVVNMIVFYFDGTDYWYTIFQDAADVPDEEEPVPGPTPLAASTLSIPEAGDGFIKINISAVANRSSINLIVDDNSGFTSPSTIPLAANVTQYTFNGTNGTTYYFKSVNVGDSVTYGNSPASNTVSGAPGVLAPETIMDLSYTGNNTVTESPDNTWNPTAPNKLLSGQKIDSGTSGIYYMDVVRPATEVMVIGLDSGNAPAAYNEMDYAIYHTTEPSLYSVYPGDVKVGAATTGEKMGLRVLDNGDGTSTIEAVKLPSGGTTWTVLTVLGENIPNQDWYLKAHAIAGFNSKLVNPKKEVL